MAKCVKTCRTSGITIQLLLNHSPVVVIKLFLRFSRGSKVSALMKRSDEYYGFNNHGIMYMQHRWINMDIFLL